MNKLIIVIGLLFLCGCVTEEIKNGKDGIDGTIGPTGAIGQTGPTGQNGNDGLNGQPCEVTQTEEGALIECYNSSAVIMNGTNGISPVLETIEPCNDVIVPFPEVFLRLSNGKLIAYFTDFDRNNHLAVLTPNTYMTTDGKDCYFQVDENNNIIEL